eukprot:363658-Chlamydomonas_euryale.AAC.3
MQGSSRDGCACRAVSKPHWPNGRRTCSSGLKSGSLTFPPSPPPIIRLPSFPAPSPPCAPPCCLSPLPLPFAPPIRPLFLRPAHAVGLCLPLAHAVGLFLRLAHAVGLCLLLAHAVGLFLPPARAVGLRGLTTASGADKRDGVAAGYGDGHIFNDRVARSVTECDVVVLHLA